MLRTLVTVAVLGRAPSGSASCRDVGRWPLLGRSVAGCGDGWEAKSKWRRRCRELRFIYNGEKANSMFSHAEMERRLSLLRAHMADNDISATVLTSMQNVCYFTGFLYCSFGRPYGTVVTADKCLTIAAGIDGGQPWRRSHGDVVIVTDWQKGNFFHIVGTILADVRGSVGFEHDHVTVDTLRAFDVALPTHTKVDVADATMRMRTIKSAEEFDVIRHGARVADIGGVAVVNAMIEGASEVEVAIASTDTMIREIATTFPDSEIRDTWTWFQSGMNTDGAHNPVTTRKLQNGDNCSLNCFPMIQG
ncbi:PREDICTED: LOW QUALITY PROTEIN: creatinase-like [Priapulus caudatus]|uniref:LOW QUALITY PROTEIN: creatinase-like n=1 Tax=Priapulus caudatus TaxID=37621 RepID=A0ABM1EX82_PRICU|nr:PREDICTED: LOW QUALITY PROTEIN: creatinase-like [Priapulus caudatus]